MNRRETNRGMGSTISRFAPWNLFNAARNAATSRRISTTSASVSVQQSDIGQLDTKEENANEANEEIGDIKINYNNSDKKLDLSSQPITVDEHFYQALSIHKNPSNVKELHLCRKPKICNIPLLIGQFENLVVLDLHDNGLIDIPWSFVYLHKLEKLDLSFNCLKYIPKIICYLQNLKVLNLKQNYLVAIPTELLQLEKLQKLDLTNNKYLGGITPEQTEKGVTAIFEILKKRQGRTDLWANSKPWLGYGASPVYLSSVPSLHELAVDSIIANKIDFLVFTNVPPRLKTYLTKSYEDHRNRIKVAKCSQCSYFYSSKELFDNHDCLR